MVDIYILFSSDEGIKYVGSTKSDVSYRVKAHWRSRHKKNTLVAQWLRILDQPPQFDVLQSVSEEVRWQAESYWTDLLRQIPGIDLCNIASGKSPAWPSESRKHLSKSMLSSDAVKNRSYSMIEGVNNGNSTLTEDQVREIRIISGTTREIGAQYGISYSAVSAIKRGITYKNVK